MKIIIFVSIFGASTTTTTIIFSNNESIRIDKMNSEEGLVDLITYKNIDKKINLMLQDNELTERPLGKTGGWVDVGLDMSQKVESFEMVDSKLHFKTTWGALECEDIYFELEDDLKIYEYGPFLKHDGKWYLFNSKKKFFRGFVNSSTILEKYSYTNESELELFEGLKDMILAKSHIKK